MNLPNMLYLPELREYLAENNAAELHEFCTALHPAATADFMEGLTPEESWAVLRYADMPTRVEIFSYFPREKQIEIIRLVNNPEIAEFIGHLAPDDRVDILEDVEPELVAQLLPLLPSEERRDILRLRAFPENTAGGVMTTEFAKLGENLTVRQALDELGQQAGELETIYYIYIVDDQDRLQGLVSARQLVSKIGKPDTRLGDLMERELITVNVNEDREEVARKVAHYDLLAIPVVDRERHMLGIITHDDVIDVVVQEATEDVYLMGGMTPIEENYLDIAFSELWRKRIGWLSLLFIAEILTVAVLARYRDMIDYVVALSYFIPLCIATGGNSGSQAATLITRAIALGQVSLHDWLRVISHESLMGLALGSSLGVIAFMLLTGARVFHPDPVSFFGTVSPFRLASVVAISVTLICLWGTITGSMLPLLLKRVGVDPAVASSPLVATLVDVTGMLIYMTVALALLPLGSSAV